MITYTVYALLCPDTKNVRYIGYTTKPLDVRLKQHYNDLHRGFKSHKTNWLSTLSSAALIIPIEENIPDLDSTVQKEIKWISSYSNLTNSTTGGERSKAYRADVRAKMSERQKAMGWKGVKNPMYGKERKDLSERNKNKVWTEEERNLRSSQKTKQYDTPEYKKLFVESQKNRKPVNQYTLNGVFVKTFPSTAAVKKEGFGSKEVQLVCKGKYKQHKGFKWAYYETEV